MMQDMEETGIGTVTIHGGTGILLIILVAIIITDGMNHVLHITIMIIHVVYAGIIGIILVIEAGGGKLLDILANHHLHLQKGRAEQVLQESRRSMI
jgi:hypothetical protein